MSTEETLQLANDDDRLPGPQTLTVVIRNPAPTVFWGDGPAYRSVHIRLTDDQREMLSLKRVGTDRGRAIYEEVSACFFEPE